MTEQRTGGKGAKGKENKAGKKGFGLEKRFK